MLLTAECDLDGLRPVLATHLPIEYLAVLRVGALGILLVPGSPPVPLVGRRSLQDQLLLFCIRSLCLSYHVCSTSYVNHISIFLMVPLVDLGGRVANAHQ